MRKSLSTSIRYLKGVGPKRLEMFSGLGISTIEDLLYYFPDRYEDRAHFSLIKDIKPGEFYTIKANILAKGQKRSWRKRGFSISEVALDDGTGRISAVWFNQPYLENYFKVGQSLILYGQAQVYEECLQMNSPEFEIVSDTEDESLNIGRIVPVYRITQGITQRHLRSIIKYSLGEFIPSVKEILPYKIRQKYNLLNMAQSLINIHFPEDENLRQEAYRRLAFEEFFLYQIPILLRKIKLKEKKGINHNIDENYLSMIIKGFPFELTNAQGKVLREIKSDMALSRPMQRLLQGDVGSGKTIVAFIAALIAVRDGKQAAFMVPTEILSQQHYSNIIGLLSKIGIDEDIKIALLTSNTTKSQRLKTYKEIESGLINLVIGTHALIEESVKFKNLSLVVIDEQHKFGVGQRALLSGKGINPDVLIMTATPIPRTLSLTIYGDLDVSVIDEMPKGRQPIETMCYSYQDEDKVYEFVKAQVKKGRQAYIVYPIIDESFLLDLKAATVMYEKLKSGTFKELRIALVHGKIKQNLQNQIMLKFKEGSIDVLIATSVLEVGIDVSNASCMVIEHAERFGLSQLHQLRGRIGRGPYESFCLLISEPKTPEAQARIAAITKSNDGFKIAQEDLRIRGPGEFFGSRQHGLTELKIGDPLKQMHILKDARREVINLLNLDRTLSDRQNILIKDVLKKRFPEYEKFIVIA